MDEIYGCSFMKIYVQKIQKRMFLYIPYSNIYLQTFNKINDITMNLSDIKIILYFGHPIIINK